MTLSFSATEDERKVMASKGKRVKVVYQDAGEDKAITGIQVLEDDNFFHIISEKSGNAVRIAKSRVVSWKEVTA